MRANETVRHAEAVITNWSAAFPYEARWHNVAQFVKHLLPALHILKTAWSEQRFKSGAVRPAAPPKEPEQEATDDVSGAYKTFSPAAMTATMKCEAFISRCHALAALDMCIERFSQWCAGCACHGDWAAKLREIETECDSSFRFRPITPTRKTARPFLQRIIAAHYNGRPCPMAGRRSPELACHHLRTVTAEVFGQGLEAFLTHLGPRSESELPALLGEFTQAKAELVGILELKLDFWNRLPYCLAGVASTDSRLAQERICGRDVRLRKLEG